MEVKTKFDVGDVAFVKNRDSFIPCEIVSISFSKYYTISGVVTRVSYNAYCGNKLQSFNEEQLLTEREKN